MFDDNPIAFADKLVEKYKYRKLPKNLSLSARTLYLDKLPSEFSLEGEDLAILTTISGTPIANGYSRIVVGDFGAFVEIPRDKMLRENICAKKGEEYRYIDPSFKNSVKYYWYTAKDRSNIKIYHQQKTVSYADYKEGFFYVCPYEIQILRNEK